MKFRSAIFLCTALLVPTLSKATITYTSYRDGGDGNLVCPVYPYGYSDTVNVTGTQNNLNTGHIITTIWTDSAIDPTLTTLAAIENDSGYAWSGYVIDVFLGVNFTLSFPSPAVTSPPGWSAAVTIAPYSTGTNYAAQITYTGGTPVNTINGDPNNTLAYGFKITFEGATIYTLTQSVTPIAVPEPTTGSFALASLLFGGWASLRRKKA